jgi:hypothetical protein
MRKPDIGLCTEPVRLQAVDQKRYFRLIADAPLFNCERGKSGWPSSDTLTKETSTPRSENRFDAQQNRAVTRGLGSE